MQWWTLHYYNINQMTTLREVQPPLGSTSGSPLDTLRPLDTVAEDSIQGPASEAGGHYLPKFVTIFYNTN